MNEQELYEEAKRQEDRWKLVNRLESENLALKFSLGAMVAFLLAAHFRTQLGFVFNIPNLLFGLAFGSAFIFAVVFSLATLIKKIFKLKRP